MLRIELVYDWMCDMSSCVDVINNKSIMRFWWFVIMASLVAFNAKIHTSWGNHFDISPNFLSLGEHPWNKWNMKIWIDRFIVSGGGGGGQMLFDYQ